MEPTYPESHSALHEPALGEDMRRRGLMVTTLLAVLTLLLGAACGGSALPPEQIRSGKPGTDQERPIELVGERGRPGPASRPPTGQAADQTDLASATTVGDLTGPLVTADVLVFSRNSLPVEVLNAVRQLKGVTSATSFSMGTFYNGDQPITYAAVDPARFRRFTPPGTAQTTAVWDRVLGSEMAIRPGLGKKLIDDEGFITIGNDDDAPRIHVGAYADLTAPKPAQTWIDAVVDRSWAKKLMMPPHNALVLSMGNNAVEPVQKQLRDIAGKDVSIQVLAHVFDVSALQTAILTGTSLAAAVGSFTYTANRNGTVNPDPRWVKENIRTEEVPILGKVTCHKVMLLQLRSALREVVQRGLADTIHPGEYGGCYYPRFIGHDPAKGLSFHTFGTALDLNVPGNLRGTVGEIDRTVVSIFQKWGFNWGGTWRYTDPMHFELARIVKAK